LRGLRILFDPEAEAGKRGGEGVRILALEPKKMLSITWSAPPELQEVRKQWTHVVIRFQEISERQTKVTLTHDGWGRERRMGRSLRVLHEGVAGRCAASLEAQILRRPSRLE
jgi:uncharacterized protein YndB with AHSA1/START domain